MNEEYVYEELTLAELGTRFGVTEFDTPGVVNVCASNIEILSNAQDGTDVYAPLTHFVVKDGVDRHYKLGDLKGTSTHQVKHNNEWVMLKDHPNSVVIEEAIKVVDVTVEGTDCYIANGQINHNTTPGGLSLPFHASTRIALSGGTQIKGKNDELIGINVIGTVIKNKVAAPFRKILFQIHFGRGIVEHEELFDVLREHCDKNKVEKDGKLLSISGTSSWKELSVADAKTGEVLVDKKFYKAEFGDIMRDPQYRAYVNDIIEASLTKTPEQFKADQYDIPADVDENGYSALETDEAAAE